jgi:hypothetical protein
MLSPGGVEETALDPSRLIIVDPSADLDPNSHHDHDASLNR